MERVATLIEAKQMFGVNFIGSQELLPFFDRLGIDINNVHIPSLEKYSFSVLEKACNDGYILILGIDTVNGKRITLEILRSVFGTNPDVSEPCFYNQDWYLEESFFKESTIETQWYLIKKDVEHDSRAIQPSELIRRGYNFPPAILCAYTFFAYYFARGEYLWYHDFIWNCDVDHNNDRIYVGKYHDIDGVNKNGFSIHRHLALRNCYGAICQW